MKMKQICLILAVLLCVLPLSVAGTKQSASINISDPVVISGTHLQPGDYTVRWSGTGSDVQVQFYQGKNQVASAPAKVVSETNANSPAISLRSTEDGSKTISEIRLSKVTLQFSDKTEAVSK